MMSRPWTRPRCLAAAVQLGALAALTLVAPVLLPAATAFAETGRATAPATPSAKLAVELEGTLDILHEDRDDGSSVYHHTLALDDGARVALHDLAPGLDLLTGDRVRVRGTRSALALRLLPSSAAGSAGLEVLAAAPLANTFSVQKTLVILVNFSDNPAQPFTVAQAQTAYGALDAWFREVSYQQTSLAVDVVGWYTLPVTTAGCDIALLQSKARQAATAAGVNLAPYVRQVYAFPFNTNCKFAGMASIGGTPSSVWINGNATTGILAHEFGHTLGLYHSHALKCHPSVLTPPCAPRSEYGDTIDAMGGARGHFNAFQKQRLGWLNYNQSPPITTVSSSGAYALDAYELPGTAPKALQIPRGTTGQAFFVELRRPVGADAGLYLTGVFIHLASVSQPDSSTLLDMTPSTSSMSDTFLDVGKPFTDPVSGLTLTTLSVTSTSATIQVDLDPSAPCVRSAPGVTATPAQSPAVAPGTAVTYTVSVTNTDTTACSATTFALQATLPTTSWSKTFGAASLTPAPGATASTTLRITSPVVVAAGAYPIAIAATSTTDARAGTTSVVYNVGPGEPPPPPPPPFLDTFDRPDSPVLDNGWAVMTGNLMIQANQGRNSPTTTFSLAVQPDLVGATQLVTASFASDNNNSGPRFGVVVRYQNPQNYYLCYRKVGGSSVLRIAKVQNGVETVLKAVGIGNPAAHAFFTLACQANGSALTLLVDGVPKLSTSHSAFTSGSAGYTISTKTGTSHRAENFTVTTQ